MQPEIPFSFLSTQTCRNCQMPVTCGPVYVVNDLSVLCGRCRMLAKDHFRNYAYEALASVFLYPCQNWRNHCPMRLKFNESLEHEEKCRYIGCCSFICTHPGAFFKGKRDIPRDEIRLVRLPDHLLDYVKCVLCECYLSCKPVYIQNNGENVCHRCVNSNGHPPHCRQNHAYEEFAKMFVFPCIFKNRGCSVRIPFGQKLWQHESECDYGTFYKKKTSSTIPANPAIPHSSTIPANPAVPHSSTIPANQAIPHNYSPADSKRTSFKQKEKGLIKTQTGVIWATITPNTDNKQLLKSLVKKQEKQRRRVGDIENELYERRNSDSESVSTSDSFSVQQNYPTCSGISTPESLEPPYRQQAYMPPEDYHARQAQNGSRPGSRESGYHTSPIQNGFYQEDIESPAGSIRYSLRPRDAYRDLPVAGNFPVLNPRQLNDGFDSLSKRYSHRESIPGNSQLISELRVRQDMIKRTHSIKGGEMEARSPFKNCNNLGDIREVHRQLS